MPPKFQRQSVDNTADPLAIYLSPMTYLAAAIQSVDTDSALVALNRVVGRVDLAEIRLDLMQTFDLPRLLAERPLPLIITCRPVREGGRWNGSEAERLAVLRQAVLLEADYVDLEWDAAAELATFETSSTRVILSRHDFSGMPTHLEAQVHALWRTGADVVKVVGMAHNLMDCLPVLRVLEAAGRPTIAIAMGALGLLTRLLAFRYANSFLSFAALDDGTGPQAGSSSGEPWTGTAPGQVTIRAMRDVYRVRSMSAETRLVGFLLEGAAASGLVVEGNEWLAKHAPDTVLVPLELAGNGYGDPDPEALSQLAPFSGYVMPQVDDGRFHCRKVVNKRTATFGRLIEALQWLIGDLKDGQLLG